MRILKLVTVILSLFFSVSLKGQDTFNSVNEALGQKVVLYGVDEMLSAAGPFMYVAENGKLKAVKDPQKYASVFGKDKPLYVTDIITNKKREYLLLKRDNDCFYLFLGSKTDYLKHLKSWSHWETEVRKNNEYRQYKNNGNADNDVHPTWRYNEVLWTGFLMPDDFNGRVLFTYNETVIDANSPNGRKVSSCSIPADEVTSGRFISNVTLDRLSKEFSDAELERNARAVVATISHTVSGERSLAYVGELFPEDDKECLVSIYSYSILKADNKAVYQFKGYYAGHEIEINENDLVFANDTDRDYIIMTTDRGIKAMRDVARAKDVELTALRKQKAFAYYNENKVFLMDYSIEVSKIITNFGNCSVHFKIYNCFDKDIKYMDFNVVPYNNVGDIQKDQFGNGQMNLHYIGPLGTKKTDTIYFEDVWWSDVISSIGIVGVTITFMDGTVISYRSKKTVDAHSRKSHSQKNM